MQHDARKQTAPAGPSLPPETFIYENLFHRRINWHRIQALFDNNPRLSRQDLGPQIHAISDDTHHQIEALLTGHQKQLVKAMQKRMHDGEESRRLLLLHHELKICKRYIAKVA